MGSKDGDSSSGSDCFSAAHATGGAACCRRRSLLAGPRVHAIQLKIDGPHLEDLPQDFAVRLQAYLTHTLHMPALHIAVGQGCVHLVVMLLELGRGAGAAGPAAQRLRRRYVHGPGTAGLTGGGGGGDTRALPARLVTFVRGVLPEGAAAGHVSVRHNHRSYELAATGTGDATARAAAAGTAGLQTVGLPSSAATANTAAAGTAGGAAALGVGVNRVGSSITSSVAVPAGVSESSYTWGSSGTRSNSVFNAQPMGSTGYGRSGSSRATAQASDSSGAGAGSAARSGNGTAPRLVQAGTGGEEQHPHRYQQRPHLSPGIHHNQDQHPHQHYQQLHHPEPQQPQSPSLAPLAEVGDGGSSVHPVGVVAGCEPAGRQRPPPPSLPLPTGPPPSPLGPGSSSSSLRQDPKSSSSQGQQTQPRYQRHRPAGASAADAATIDALFWPGEQQAAQREQVVRGRSSAGGAASAGAGAGASHGEQLLLQTQRSQGLDYDAYNAWLGSANVSRDSRSPSSLTGGTGAFPLWTAPADFGAGPGPLQSLVKAEAASDEDCVGGSASGARDLRRGPVAVAESDEGTARNDARPDRPYGPGASASLRRRRAAAAAEEQLELYGAGGDAAASDVLKQLPTAAATSGSLCTGAAITIATASPHVSASLTSVRRTAADSDRAAGGTLSLLTFSAATNGPTLADRLGSPGTAGSPAVSTSWLPMYTPTPRATGSTPVQFVPTSNASNKLLGGGTGGGGGGGAGNQSSDVSGRSMLLDASEVLLRPLLPPNMPMTAPMQRLHHGARVELLCAAVAIWPPPPTAPPAVSGASPVVVSVLSAVAAAAAVSAASGLGAPQLSQRGAAAAAASATAAPSTRAAAAGVPGGAAAPGSSQAGGVPPLRLIMRCPDMLTQPQALAGATVGAASGAARHPAGPHTSASDGGGGGGGADHVSGTSRTAASVVAVAAAVAVEAGAGGSGSGGGVPSSDGSGQEGRLDPMGVAVSQVSQLVAWSRNGIIPVMQSDDSAEGFTRATLLMPAEMLLLHPAVLLQQQQQQQARGGSNSNSTGQVGLAVGSSAATSGGNAAVGSGAVGSGGSTVAPSDGSSSATATATAAAAAPAAHLLYVAWRRGQALGPPCPVLLLPPGLEAVAAELQSLQPPPGAPPVQLVQLASSYQAFLGDMGMWLEAVHVSVSAAAAAAVAGASGYGVASGAGTGSVRPRSSNAPALDKTSSSSGTGTVTGTGTGTGTGGGGAGCESISPNLTRALAAAVPISVTITLDTDADDGTDSPFRTATAASNVAAPLGSAAAASVSAVVAAVAGATPGSTSELLSPGHTQLGASLLHGSASSAARSAVDSEERLARLAEEVLGVGCDLLAHAVACGAVETARLIMALLLTHGSNATTHLNHVAGSTVDTASPRAAAAAASGITPAGAAAAGGGGTRPSPVVLRSIVDTCRSGNDQGHTLLHLAVLSRSVAMLRLVLRTWPRELGLPVQELNRPDRYGRTPLNYLTGNAAGGAASWYAQGGAVAAAAAGGGGSVGGGLGLADGSAGGSVDAGGGGGMLDFMAVAEPLLRSLSSPSAPEPPCIPLLEVQAVGVWSRDAAAPQPPRQETPARRQANAPDGGGGLGERGSRPDDAVGSASFVTWQGWGGEAGQDGVENRLVGSDTVYMMPAPGQVAAAVAHPNRPLSAAAAMMALPTAADWLGVGPGVGLGVSRIASSLRAAASSAASGQQLQHQSSTGAAFSEVSGDLFNVDDFLVGDGPGEAGRGAADGGVGRAAAPLPAAVVADAAAHSPRSSTAQTIAEAPSPLQPSSPRVDATATAAESGDRSSAGSDVVEAATVVLAAVAPAAPAAAQPSSSPPADQLAEQRPQEVAEQPGRREVAGGARREMQRPLWAVLLLLLGSVQALLVLLCAMPRARILPPTASLLVAPGALLWLPSLLLVLSAVLSAAVGLLLPAGRLEAAPWLPASITSAGRALACMLSLAAAVQLAVVQRSGEFDGTVAAAAASSGGGETGGLLMLLADGSGMGSLEASLRTLLMNLVPLALEAVGAEGIAGVPPQMRAVMLVSECGFTLMYVVLYDTMPAALAWLSYCAANAVSGMALAALLDLSARMAVAVSGSGEARTPTRR